MLNQPARLGPLSVLVLSVIAAIGCGPPRRQWQPEATATTTGGGTTVTTSGVLASGTPSEQLAQLDGVLGAQGFAPRGPTLQGQLPEGGLLAYAIVTQPDRCYTLAVFGESPSQNIDLILIDPYGRPAGHHVREDNHPWVSFCANQRGRFIARVQMASGGGNYLYRAYEGPANHQMEISRFFGQEPASDAQIAEMDSATQGRLAALDRELGGTGYQRVAPPAGLVLNDHTARRFQLNLARSACYVFAGLATGGSSDLELSLNADSGEPLAAEQDPGPQATLRYCAPASGSYQLSVRLISGQGSVFTTAYVENASASAALPVMASTSTGGGNLNENFALIDADMRARGYERMGDTANGQLTRDERQTREVALEGGRCYALLAVGDASVTNLDLQLSDPHGAEVDRDIAMDARPTVRVCPTRNLTYSLETHMTAGAGAYLYAQYRWPRGTSGPFGLEGVSWVRLSEVTALLGVEGYNPDPGFTPENGRLRRTGAIATHHVELTAGQCYAVVVVGGEGINDLDVSISLGEVQLSSDFGNHNAFPSVRQCVEADGRYTITITAADGSGTYHYQVFSRSGADES